ncbi:Uncharacterised protein [Actinomadura madurae]|nr:Uncharacterised protein [Actinomadura madurae]
MLTSEPDRTDAVGGRPKAGFAYSHRHDDVEIVVMNRPETPRS